MKPALVMARGPTVQEFLEVDIDHKLFDIVVFNNFMAFIPYFEKHGISPDIVYNITPGYPTEEMEKDDNELVDYVLKNDGRYVTSRVRIDKYGLTPSEKIEETDVDDQRLAVGTFGLLLFYLVKKGYKKIFLVGADGGVVDGYDNEYYDDERYKADRSMNDLINDTNKINKNFWSWVSRHLPDKSVDIYNCSIVSNLNCFKKIRYDEIMRYA